MPTSVTVIVGTRKGCFLLESDGDRRDWEMRGPFCDGWPVYHAIHDAASGTLFAACASEWHGAGVWRSSDLGENWELSSEGLSYGEDGDLKLSKVSGLTAAHGRLLAGAESAGVWEPVRVLDRALVHRQVFLVVEEGARSPFGRHVESSRTSRISSHAVRC